MPDSRWSVRRGAGRKALMGSLGVVLGGIALALVAGYALERHNRIERAERFAQVSARLAGDVQHRMGTFEHGLRGARGAVIASGEQLSRERFTRYSESREYAREFPGVLGFGYVQRVPEQEREAFVAKARADGAPGFRIQQLQPHRGDSFVTLYFGPEPARDGPAGLDLASEPARRAAALAAARTGRPTITRPLRLQRAPARGEDGFLVLLPSYQAGLALDTPQQREQATVGWAFAVLSVDRLLAEAISRQHDALVTLADGQQPDAPFYRSPWNAPAARTPGVVNTDLLVYGRQWRLAARPTRAFIASLNQVPPWTVMAGLFATSLLLAALLYLFLSNQYRRNQVLRKQSELASLVSHSSEAIIAEDTAGRITHWNPAAERMFGHSRAKALGQSRIQLLAPEPYLPTSVAELMPAGHADSGTLVEQMRHRDGHTVYVLSSIAPIMGRRGRRHGRSHFLRDVTDRALAQQRVLEANANLEQQVQERTGELMRFSSLHHAILAHAGYAIIAVDPLGQITLFNPAAEKLLGYSAHDMIGQHDASVFLEDSELARRAEHASLHAAKPVPARLEAIAAETSLGRSDTSEWTYVARNGRRLPVLLTLSTLLDQTDQVIGYLAIAVDLTEQKLREQQLRLAIDSAESANRSKSDFLANMSHEIRTPMNAILGMLYLLQRTNMAPSSKDMVHKIDLAARSLLEIINDILDFSKIEAGRIDLEMAPFDLNQMMDNLAALMSNSLSSKPVEMVVESLPEADHWFIGDALRLNQVLINLVGNAVKFTEQGEVVLSVRSFPVANGNRVKLLFSVRDTGIGISRDKQGAIFSPFLQADTSTSRQFGGSGLGLTISTRLVELMGGQLEVDSAPGQGSEFYFAIVLERCRPAGAAATPTPRAMVPAQANAPRVLIADDHELALGNLTGIATGLGWDVHAVSSGQAALDAIRTATVPFDIYLLDWCMPNVDGLEVAQQIRARSPAGTHPVIVMVTAYERRLLEQHPDQPGIDAVLTKPVNATTLHRTVIELGDEGAVSRTLKQAEGHQRLAGARLLLVDDSLVNCEVAQRILQGEGAAVEIAHDGQMALDMLRQHRGHIHLVLMDVQMPNMDGYEATRRLRQDDALSDLPVIALTAGAFRQQEERALQAGMNAFVTKPFQVDELVAIIQQFLPRAVRICSLATQAAAHPVAVAGSGWYSPDPDLVDGARAQGFWGDPAPYQRYLSRLMSEAPDLSDQLSALVEAGDRASAIAQAHKLRGSAGSLALPRLSAAAGYVEEELDAGRTALDALSDLRVAVQETIEAIAAFLRRNPLPGAAEAGNTGAAETGDLDDPLSVLLVALQSDDLDRIEAALARVAPRLPADLLARLRLLVENFDFHLAEDQVQRYQADIT